MVENKIENNKERYQQKKLSSDGWKVIEIYECELKHKKRLNLNKPYKTIKANLIYIAILSSIY